MGEWYRWCVTAQPRSCHVLRPLLNGLAQAECIISDSIASFTVAFQGYESNLELPNQLRRALHLLLLALWNTCKTDNFFLKKNHVRFSSFSLEPFYNYFIDQFEPTLCSFTSLGMCHSVSSLERRHWHVRVQSSYFFWHLVFKHVLVSSSRQSPSLSSLCPHAVPLNSLATSELFWQSNQAKNPSRRTLMMTLKAKKKQSLTSQKMTCNSQIRSLDPFLRIGEHRLQVPLRG